MMGIQYPKVVVVTNLVKCDKKQSIFRISAALNNKCFHTRKQIDLMIVFESNVTAWSRI